MSGFIDPYRMLLGWWASAPPAPRGPFAWDELDAFAPGVEAGDDYRPGVVEADAYCPGLEDGGEHAPGFQQGDIYSPGFEQAAASVKGS